MLRFLSLLGTTLILSLSCVDNPKKNKGAISFVYPAGYDSADYSKMQTNLRKKILDSFGDTTSLHIFKKTYKDSIEIYFHESIRKDDSILIPAKFNLDIRKDYKTPIFSETYTYIVNKDTLINLCVAKKLFANVADSNLIKYGVLRSLVTGKDMIVTTSDSFHLNFMLSIPGTKFGKIVKLAGDSLGAYSVY